MHLGIPSWQVRSSEVSVKCDGAVDFWVLPNRLSGCEILYTVGKEVRMLISEYERTEFHDGYESGEEIDFGVRVSTVNDS